MSILNIARKYGLNESDIKFVDKSNGLQFYVDDNKLGYSKFTDFVDELNTKMTVWSATAYTNKGHSIIVR